MPEDSHKQGSSDQPAPGLVDKAKEVAGTAAKKAEPAMEKAKESAGGFWDRLKGFFSSKSDGAK